MNIRQDWRADFNAAAVASLRPASHGNLTADIITESIPGLQRYISAEAIGRRIVAVRRNF
ncbi:MAG: hypothetical protein ABSG87_07615 [Verrucomicrobiota bacterium]